MLSIPAAAAEPVALVRCIASPTSLLIAVVICGSRTDQDADSIDVNAAWGTVVVVVVVVEELVPDSPALDDEGTAADRSVFAI